MSPNPSEVDVLVVGGGAAGLSAAVTLGRARRRALVVDAGEPRNAPADGVHGFLSRDGTPPGELLAAGRAEVERYGGQVRAGEAVSATAVDGGFDIELADGDRVRARRLLVATGLVDQLPEIPGLRERWGRDVIHCPYCHGWEVQDRAIGVIGSGPMAVHQTLLFRQWTNDLTLFVHTAPPLTDEQAEQLAARDITVIVEPVVGVEASADRLTGVRLADGRTIARDALVVGGRMVARSPILDSLGLEPVPHPLGEAVGVAYPTTDPTGATSIPGLWLAGNVADIQAQVISAAAQGVMAAAMVNADLIASETAAAVEARRSQDRRAS